MRRFHVAIGVADISRSIEDYSRRLGEPPCVVVPGEYALWRTATLNVSIRRTTEEAGVLRHLGWEESSAAAFTKDVDHCGITWEHFNAEQQDREILDTWPNAEMRGRAS